MFDWTFLKVSLNSSLTFVQSITQTTGKLFVVWMYWMMISQSSCCTETLWTFTANIRLHRFMSLNVYFEVTFAAEFLLTNVTREPSTFIVWLQQMCLELIRPCKTDWTVSTWVRLCISVNTNMTLQITVNLNQHPTVRTFIRSTLLCTSRLCRCKLLEVLKLLSHREHLCGFSPVWTLMWAFRFVDWLNAFWHTWHLYGFCPLWILLWLTRLPDCVNRLPQTIHSNGFSPEWLCLCTARALLLWQHLPHSAHLYLSVWIFICRISSVLDEHRLSHWVHKYTFSPVWHFLCSFNLALRVNRLSQTVNTCSLGFSLCGRSETLLLSASVWISDAWDLSTASTLASNVTERPTHAEHSRHACAHVANTHKQSEMTRSGALD